MGKAIREQDDNRSVMLSAGVPVTLSQVALRAGVAPSTASLAFNYPDRVAASTRERVHAAAEELGYSGPTRGADLCGQGGHARWWSYLPQPLRAALQDAEIAGLLAEVLTRCGQIGYDVTVAAARDTMASVPCSADAVICLGEAATWRGPERLPVLHISAAERSGEVLDELLEPRDH